MIHAKLTLALLFASLILNVHTVDWLSAPPVDNEFAKIIHRYKQPEFCLAKDQRKDDAASRFQVLRTKVVRKAKGDLEPIDFSYVGRIPTPTPSKSSFIMNSLFLPFREARARWWRYHANSMRSDETHHALVDWKAFGGFSGFVRTMHALNLAMGCLGVATKEMKTEVGAKVFADLWAPRTLGWDIIDTLQSTEDRHGAVLYYNVQSETLAVVFRPYSDPEVYLPIKQRLLAADATVEPVPLRGWDDDSNEFIPIQVKEHHIPSPRNSDDDASVYILAAARPEYERTERLVIERLNKLAKEGKLPGKRLMVTGHSAGGLSSQSFAIRLALRPPKFMRQKQFESKEILTFNAPPGFSKEGAFSALENVLEDGGWNHRRVVGEDQNSIFWFGLVETRPRRKLYSHLGKPILVSRYPKQIGVEQYNAVFAYKLDEPDFPNDLIPWTTIRTDEDAIRHEDTVPKHKLDIKAWKFRLEKEWMGMLSHILGLGISLLEIGETVKAAGKCMREQWSQLMYASQEERDDSTRK
ncbi:hypothetical protein BKA69DRAFT_1176664 [Paraphysoderma sedebokerense]|nr:hypothetical protein BKA69DRAFT_1176664 [Paraphysoderma sedebokerense]